MIIEYLPIGIVVTVGLFLFKLIETLLWNNSNSTQKKLDAIEARFRFDIEKLERKVDINLSEINLKLSEIKSIVDKTSVMERPVGVCRDYLDRHLEPFCRKLDSILEHIKEQ